jgi:predicted ATP-grasp superfamily ATP-dependent carboligase
MLFDRIVILGSTLTALAVARDAHHHRLQPVVVDMADGPAFSSRWAKALVLRPDDDVLHRLKQESGPSVALVATADHWVRFIHEHRSALDAAFGCLLHPANDTIDICLDKLRFASWCAAQDLPAPLSWVGGRDRIPAGAEFPMLIRPAHTQHAVAEPRLPKAIEAHDPNELDQWLARYADAAVTPLVSESLLSRDLEQVSVGFARHREGTLAFTARKLRPAPARCAVGSCVELYDDPASERLASLALKRLDYFGIGEVEILHDRQSGERFLIEINARPWLQYALAPASGHDFLQWMLGAQGPSRVARRQRSGKTWVCLKDDLFNAFSRSVGEVRRGERGAFEYLASLFRCNVFAAFDWRDPMPAWIVWRGSAARRPSTVARGLDPPHQSRQ